MGVGYNPKTVTNGLVLCLDAGNTKSYPGSGTTWYDLSGNGINGTFTTALGSYPPYSTNNGGRFNFRGVSSGDGVLLGNASSFMPTVAISVSIWVLGNSASNQADYRKFFCVVDSGTQNIRSIYFSQGPSTDYIYFGAYTSSYAYVSTADTSGPLSTSQYTNLVGTYDGSYVRLYKNGSLVSSAAQTGTLSTAGIGRICGYDNGKEYIDGYMSTFSMHNRALSDAEVKQNFNALRGRFSI